jgi:uncharacterized protein
LAKRHHVTANAQTAFRLAVAFVVLALSTPAPAQTSANLQNITIATATPTGNYFTTGNAICRLVSRQGLFLPSGDVTKLDCGATTTTGSMKNVELLRAHETEFALVQSDFLYQAFNGKGRFEGRPAEQLRVLFSLNQEAFQILAARGTNIQTWSDLQAKKVNLGPLGTTSNTMFQELLQLHGTDQKWFAQALTIPTTTHVQELCEGNIEALGQTTGVPNASLTDADRRCGASLVAVDTPEVRKMLTERSYYAAVVIPSGTFAGQKADVRTFGVVATLVATADVSDEVVYSTVRAVFEGLETLKAMLPTLKHVTPEGMIRDGLAAPIHPGALRYYQERGWRVGERPTTSSKTTATLQPTGAPEVAPSAQTAPPAIATKKLKR